MASSSVWITGQFVGRRQMLAENPRLRHSHSPPSCFPRASRHRVIARRAGRTPIGPQGVRRDGTDGTPFGEVLVFTGTLSMPRRMAADAATDAGCPVVGGVTKHTTLLVVGDEDVRRLAGHDKSSKHRKAEELIAKGQPMRIPGESDFRRVVLLSYAAVGGS